MPRTRQGYLLVLAMIAVAIFGLMLAFGRRWFPAVAAEHAPGVQRMIGFTLAASGTFFVVGHLVLAGLLIRGLKGGRGPAPRLSAKREWMSALVPAVVMALVAEGGVLLLGLPVWAKYYGPPPPDAMTIEITGQQFRWLIRYPGADGRFGKTAPELIKGMNYVGLDAADAAAQDDILSVGELVLPKDRPVRILLRATDVIHSFFVPELRVKQDAVPGMTIEIWFTPTVAGEYEIACNQICGLGHYRMRGDLAVVTDAEFAAWMKGQEPFAGEVAP